MDKNEQDKALLEGAARSLILSASILEDGFLDHKNVYPWMSSIIKEMHAESAIMFLHDALMYGLEPGEIYDAIRRRASIMRRIKGRFAKHLYPLRSSIL